MNLNNNFIEPT